MTETRRNYNAERADLDRRIDDFLDRNLPSNEIEESMLRMRLHIFFGLEGLGDCLGTDHTKSKDALCVRAFNWARNPLRK